MMWGGAMDWPVAEDWVCETCGGQRLEWGLRNGTCRCYNCHTQYRMRDNQLNVVNIPISQLKEEYREPVKEGWKLYETPISEWTDEMWDQVML